MNLLTNYFANNEYRHQRFLCVFER